MRPVYMFSILALLTGFFNQAEARKYKANDDGYTITIQVPNNNPAPLIDIACPRFKKLLPRQKVDWDGRLRGSREYFTMLTHNSFMGQPIATIYCTQGKQEIAYAEFKAEAIGRLVNQMPGLAPAINKGFQRAVDAADFMFQRYKHMGMPYEILTGAKPDSQEVYFELQYFDRGSEATYFFEFTASKNSPYKLNQLTIHTRESGRDWNKIRRQANAGQAKMKSSRAMAIYIANKMKDEFKQLNELARSRNHQIYFKNKCRQTIWTAVRYRKAHGKDNWTATGWFKLTPGQERHVAYSAYDTIYTYGETNDGRNAWKGSYRFYVGGKVKKTVAMVKVPVPNRADNKHRVNFHCK